MPSSCFRLRNQGKVCLANSMFFKQVEVPFVGFLIWHILKVYMECVVIEFFKVMSTVLHTPLVFILFTTIFADSRISFASLSPITTSVVFHIVFVKILSNHFLDAVLDHLICIFICFITILTSPNSLQVLLYLPPGQVRLSESLAQHTNMCKASLHYFLIVSSLRLPIFLHQGSGKVIVGIRKQYHKALQLLTHNLQEYLIYFVKICICIHNFMPILYVL